MMLTALKIIHFFCLFGGGAAMMGNGILMRKVMASGGPPGPVVADTMKRLGMIGLASIVLLWATGIVMLVISSAVFDWTLILKLLAAAVVLAAVVTMSLTSARAARENRPPNQDFMKRLSLASSASAALAVVFAVLAFG
ncbi:MAG: hypothetical protein QNJ35_08740 [Paracoccaceae bacterium]|nr:hypothetical protein [Paracoccaceae bacterium]